MKCTKCNGNMIVTGVQKEDNAIHRSKRCENCGHIMYTMEIEAEDSGERFHYLRSQYQLNKYYEWKRIGKKK